MWKESGGTLGAACVDLNSRDDLPDVPSGGKQPKPSKPDSVKGGGAFTTLAAPLSEVDAGVVPTPPAPALPAAQTTLDSGGNTTTAQPAVDEDELRNFVRVRCAGQGLKSGTGVLNEVFAGTARRFTSIDAATIARVIDEELAQVREAQLLLAGVATREQALVETIAGKEPTAMQRLVTTLRNDGRGYGNGRLVRAFYNRKVALPARKAVEVVEAHDRAVEPGRAIVQA
jgi:hypothetical protein